MNRIKWIICEDDKYLSYVYISELSKFDDLEFCGNVYNSAEVVSLVKEKKPNVVLLDIQIECEFAGIEVVLDILEVDENIKVVMLTSYDNDEYIFQAFANGARDYVLKTASKEEIHTAMVNAYNENSTLSPKIANIITKRTREVEFNQKSLLFLLEIMTRLSATEFEILKAIYLGDSYTKIAKDRYVDSNTVRSHVSRILKKFGHSTMKELIKELKQVRVFDLFTK